MKNTTEAETSSSVSKSANVVTYFSITMLEREGEGERGRVLGFHREEAEEGASMPNRDLRIGVTRKTFSFSPNMSFLSLSLLIFWVI